MRRPEAEPPQFPVLLADIGGTNARFALLADPAANIQVFAPAATADFPDIQSAIESCVLAHTVERPRSALVAVAGPVTGDGVDLTNAHWNIRPRDMIAHLGLVDVVLRNDFEALALSLTALAPEDLVQIGGGEPKPELAKVAVGPGTGLGVGGLVPAASIWVPVPGEGGHVEIGPVEADEFPVWANIEPENGRISAEALLSGRGIVRLYRAVARTLDVSPVHATPAAVTDAALAGSDLAAVRALDLYARLLGRIAGDMALIFISRGGVFLGGGIPPRILPFLRAGGLRAAFEAKPPHEAMMAEIPIYVITRDNPALPGLAAFARTPASFGLSLVGRRWQADDGR